MGVYSDVALVLSKELDQKLKDYVEKEVKGELKLAFKNEEIPKFDGKLIKDLLGYAKHNTSEDSERYIWEDEKWYEDNSEYECYHLHTLLNFIDPNGESYQIYKLTESYMSEGFSPLETFGAYYDGDLHPVVQVRFV